MVQKEEDLTCQAKIRTARPGAMGKKEDFFFFFSPLFLAAGAVIIYLL